MDDIPMRMDFRGAYSLRVVRMSSLDAELPRDELRALYLRYQDQPRKAALIRLLREISGRTPPTTSLKTLSQQMLQLGHTTVAGWLRQFEDEGVLVQDYNNERLVLYAVPIPGDMGDVVVDDSTLDAWLHEAARVPSPFDAQTMEEKRFAALTQHDQLVSFFYEVCAARDHGRGSIPLKGSAGNKAKDTNIARALCRDYTLRELKPLLVFYLFDWTNDTVAKYGRTLYTFKMNLALIQEEYDDVKIARPNYAVHKLKEYGLTGVGGEDPHADVVARKRAETAAAIRAHNLKEWGHDVDVDAEDDGVDIEDFD